MTYGERIQELEEIHLEKKKRYQELIGSIKFSDNLVNDPAFIALQLAIQERDKAAENYREFRDIVLRKSKKRDDIVPPELL